MQTQAISSFLSRDAVAFKVLQPDWLRAFWVIPEEPDFSTICGI